MPEHSRIKKCFAPLAVGEAGSFNLTDDAAILAPPMGKSLVITTDSVIEGIHLLSGSTPQQFAQKLVRRNLSDLAAMGASPWRYLLNLHTPRGLSDDWFALFASALAEEQQHFGMVLVGGDSTSGDAPIHATMTCLGLIEGSPLRRNSACMGDDVYVSGTVGDAAVALSLLQHHEPCPPALAARYFAPEPRLALAKMLQQIASAAMDVSDGLLADLQQICAASHVGATLRQAAIPLSAHVRNAALDAAAKLRASLNGGDDYELLFTAAPEHRARIESLATALQLPLARIGEITAATGVHVLDAQGKPLPITHTGFEHA